MILREFKKIFYKGLIWLGLGLLLICGYKVYDWHYHKTANWQLATLYFNQLSPKEPFTGYFVVENDSLKVEKICVDRMRRRKNKRCALYEYFYQEKKGKRFKTKEVYRYEILSKNTPSKGNNN